MPRRLSRQATGTDAKMATIPELREKNANVAGSDEGTDHILILRLLRLLITA
jgi:hypothetical protein